MSGETDLRALLGGMTAQLQDGVYVFATLPGPVMPEGVMPRMLFREAEGTTLILLQHEAERAGIFHEFPCRMITLNVHSALEAVGFIARIATALAAEDMGVNPVAGYYHDHLFVPLGREQDALRIIADLSRKAQIDG
jgi:hypothetical protein